MHIQAMSCRHSIECMSIKRGYILVKILSHLRSCSLFLIVLHINILILPTPISWLTIKLQLKKPCVFFITHRRILRLIHKFYLVRCHFCSFFIFWIYLFIWLLFCHFFFYFFHFLFFRLALNLFHKRRFFFARFRRLLLTKSKIGKFIILLTFRFFGKVYQFRFLEELMVNLFELGNWLWRGWSQLIK